MSHPELKGLGFRMNNSVRREFLKIVPIEAHIHIKYHHSPPRLLNPQPQTAPEGFYGPSGFGGCRTAFRFGV